MIEKENVKSCIEIDTVYYKVFSKKLFFPSDLNKESESAFSFSGILFFLNYFQESINAFIYLLQNKRPHPNSRVIIHDL